MLRSTRLALTLCALLFVSSASAVEDVSVGLSMARGEGCYVSTEGIGLWSALWGDDAIYLEAEDAEALTLVEGRTVLDDPGCAGGACLAFVTNAEYPLTITEPGQYQAWARTYLPRPGSWNHIESMDGGAERQVSDSAQWTFGRWFWTELGAYNLGAGDHRFRLHNYLGGAKIDCIVFTADASFDPKVITGVPAGPEAVTGTVTSGEVLPSAVEAWRSLDWDADLNSGSIEASASVDGGLTWQEVRDGDLSALEADGDGDDALLVRFELATGAEGSPLLHAASVDLAVSDDAEVALENEHYRVLIARQTGRLAGIENAARGVACTPLHMQQPIVGLAVREPRATEQTVIAPDEFAFEGLRETESGAQIDYSALDGSIRVRVEMTAGASALCDWDITVDNRSALEVIRIDFPLVGDAAIGDYRDDRFVLPETAGRIVDQPATDKPWMDTYHGGGSMSFIDLCDAEAGLMVHMMDQTLRDTEMECAPAAGAESVDLAMRTHTLVRPGASVRRSYRIGVHPGDWHWAADRYREWAQGWMEPPQNPEWLHWCDGWLGASGVPFDGMTDRLAQARLQGIDYLQYWGQMADGIDQCCGNFYWPAPALGGAEGFAAGVAATQAAGGHVTGYMNCRTWTRDAPINETLRLTPKTALPQEALDLIHGLDWFERWRLYPLSGEPVPYTLGWFIMCPSSTGFQEHLRFWIAEMYAKRFGTDGVYIDQTGASRSMPCYNLEHGHDDIGAWGSGNVEMLRTSLAAARKTNPEFIIAIEGAGDALGQYANLHLISGLCTHPEVFHYTFPDYILISGMSNNSSLTSSQRITRAFLNGDRYDSRVEAAGMHSALRLRRRIKQWLYPARFMDTVGLSVSSEDVLARWNMCSEEGERAIVVNFDNEQQVADAVCSLELPTSYEQPRRLFVFDREGGVRAEQPRVTGNVLQFAVPASTLSSALALYETLPEHAVDVWQAVQGDAPVSDRLDLRAANLSDAPVTATVALEAGAPLSIAGGPRELSIPAGETAELRVPVAGAELLAQPTLVTLRVNWPGGKRESIAELRPLLLNHTLAIDADRDDIPDYWLAGGTKNSFPRGVEDGATWFQGLEGQYLYLRQEVPLQPNTEYTFSAEIMRTAGEGNVSAAVVEHLATGGLRLHGIGEDGATDRWERFETTFTTGAEFRNVIVYLYNTHSTVRAWFRNIELREN